MNQYVKYLMGEQFEIHQMNEQYIQEAADLTVRATQLRNPIFKNLQIEDSVLKKSYLQILSEKKNWYLSFVLIDKQNNNKVIGVSSSIDFYDMEKNPPSCGNSRKDFKTMIDLELLDQELKKNYQKGFASYTTIWVADPECNVRGVGSVLLLEQLRRVYFAGFQRLVNVQYNKQATKMTSKDGGYIAKHIDLKQKQVDGLYLFKDNDDGASLHIIDLNDKFMMNSGFGEWIAMRQNQQQINSKL